MAKQLCQLCRTVLTSLMTEIIPCSVLLFSIQLCRHSLLSWPAIWSIKGGGGRWHTQTHRDLSVLPLWLRGFCLTVSVCGGFIFETGKGQKTTKTAEPSFLLLPLLQLPGDEHSAALILSPSSLNHSAHLHNARHKNPFFFASLWNKLYL